MEIKQNFKSYVPLFDKFYSSYLMGFANTQLGMMILILLKKMRPFFEMFDDPINAMGFFDFKFVMPSLLQMGDRMSSAFG